MRHRKSGRKFGRNPNHQRALMRNLASSLFLTEREPFEGEENAPKVKGRIVTTLEKAKEIRPLVEKCVTLAKRTLPSQRDADKLETEADRDSSAWKSWRQGDGWRKWNQAVAPVVAARRRALVLLGDKEAVKILFEDVAPRYEDRPGGYTRILRLAKPRLGDAGTRAILEFVGVGGRDRAADGVIAPEFEDEAEGKAEKPKGKAAAKKPAKATAKAGAK